MVALWLNIIGMKSGRWLQNLGGLAQWIPAIVAVAVGVVALLASGSATPMPASSLLPSFSKLDTVIFFSQMCFAFAGLELAPIMAGEIHHARSSIPRALVLSGVTIAAIYVLSTLALMWALPSQKVSIIGGINQAIAQAGVAHGMPWLGPPVALLMTLAGLGGLGAWLIGSARLLFVGGMDRFLPPAFARIHPRWNTPHVALLVQGGLAAAFILAATLGSSVHTAYLMLADATLIVYFIPYLYMFAAAIAMRRRLAQTQGALALPGGAAGSWLINGIGASSSPPISLMLFNSLVMALVICIGKIAISIIAAYAIVYFQFPLRMTCFWLIFITLMLPVEVRILPTYKVVADLGMLDSYAGLTIPLIASATATFLFRQFFLSVPDELTEAARIDGAGPIRFFIDILLPLSRTSIAALFVIQFIYGWNQYLWPLVVTTKQSYYTIVMGISRLINVVDIAPSWNLAMATAILAMIPPVVVVIAMQRWFVKGLVETEK